MSQSPPVPDDLVLVSGLRLAEGEPGLLTVLGGAETLTLVDTPSVRRLLDVLADRPLTDGHDDGSDDDSDVGSDVDSDRALTALIAAGLTEPRVLGVAAAAARTTARVLIDAGGPADACTTTAIELLLASGVAVTTRSERVTHVLVLGHGDVDPGRIEEWSRRDVPHLVLVDRGRTVTIGPFVHPGQTSCLHCVGAHLRDPAHPDVVADLAAGEPLGSGAEPALAAAAIAWAVRDLVVAVEGGRPSTWSATVTLSARRGSGLSTTRREWRRHPDCGCAWDEVLRSG